MTKQQQNIGNQKSKRVHRKDGGWCASIDQIYVDNTASRKYKHRIGRGDRRRSQRRLYFPTHLTSSSDAAEGDVEF